MYTYIHHTYIYIYAYNHDGYLQHDHFGRTLFSATPIGCSSASLNAKDCKVWTAAKLLLRILHMVLLHLQHLSAHVTQRMGECSTLERKPKVVRNFESRRKSPHRIAAIEGSSLFRLYDYLQSFYQTEGSAQSSA